MPVLIEDKSVSVMKNFVASYFAFYYYISWQVFISILTFILLPSAQVSWDRYFFLFFCSVHACNRKKIYFKSLFSWNVLQSLYNFRFAGDFNVLDFKLTGLDIWKPDVSVFNIHRCYAIKETAKSCKLLSSVVVLKSPNNITFRKRLNTRKVFQINFL